MRLTTHAPLAALLISGLVSTFSAHAQSAADACKLEITGNDAIQYDKKSLKVGAGCKEVTLTLKHVGKLPVEAMGHNWVLARTADITGVVNDGLQAGLQNDYVKQDDPRVIAHTDMIGGGKSTSITFSTSALKKGESYTYVCTFPGHSATMRGTLTFG